MRGGGRRERSGRGGAVPGALLAIAVAVGLAAVAYAAAPNGVPSGSTVPVSTSALWRPTILQHPDKIELAANARFDFSAGRGAQRFRCRLDDRDWKACGAPIVFAKLMPGRHSFAVRAFGRRGRRSAVARFRWRVLEPKGFAIVPQLSGIGSLYPGAPAVGLPVTIDNPNPVPILVTDLRVAATADPPGCGRAENLFLAPASLSRIRPLRVPAGGTASLPTRGISPPAIQLRDLPVNQDACQNARFPLAFSGTAHG